MYTSTGYQACVGYDTPCVESVATQRKVEVAQMSIWATKYQLAVVHLDFNSSVYEPI
jgi:hypothetical protein